MITLLPQEVDFAVPDLYQTPTRFLSDSYETLPAADIEVKPSRNNGPKTQRLSLYPTQSNGRFGISGKNWSAFNP